MSIDYLCQQVAPGTSDRFDCPACGGKNSLVINKFLGRGYYKCWKASCKLRKSFAMKMSNSELKTHLEAQTEEVAPFVLPMYWVRGIASRKCFQMLLNGNALETYTNSMFKIAYDPRLDRLCFLITDEQDRIVGATGRACSGQLPKAWNYPGSAKVPFTCGTGSMAVLVEDALSACSIARFPEYTGIAMMGTELKVDYLQYLKKKFKTIVIAHDKDALIKSIRLRFHVKFHMNEVVIWKLNKDLKNMNKQDIVLFLSNSNNIIT